MKRIVFITGSLARGGTQRVITLLANKFVHLGWDVHIVALLENDKGYKLSEQVTMHDLTRSGNYYLSLPCWILRLRRLLKTLKPSVVVSLVGRINLITMISAYALKIPVLVSERNDPAHDRRSMIEKKLCAAMYGRAECVVFQTKYQQNYYRDLCKDNSVIIGNPVAAPVYEEEHESRDVISVGKLMPQKNHPMLIKAFAKIADKHPEINVHIFGEGQERETLQNLIKLHHLEGRVFLEGNISNIFCMMHTYKYFVMTSDYEGLSNALLEAMMSGMICITTDWNGVEDIIVEGENGIIVGVGKVDQLSEKLNKVLSEGALADHYGKAAIETAKNYNADAILEKWCDVIENLHISPK